MDGSYFTGIGLHILETRWPDDFGDMYVKFSGELRPDDFGDAYLAQGDRFLLSEVIHARRVFFTSVS